MATRAILRTTGAAVVEASKRQLTVRGIDNLGNTCFLNTVLQSLATLQPFVSYLETSLKKAGSEKSSSISRLVLNCLQDLMPVEKPPRETIRPHDLARRLYAEHPELRLTEQQDAEELFQILVAEIERELRRAQRPVEAARGLKGLLSSAGRIRSRSGSLDGSFMVERKGAAALGSSMISSVNGSQRQESANPLQGWLASTLQCCECHDRRPVRNSAFIDISLHLPESKAWANRGNSGSNGSLNGEHTRLVLNGGAVFPLHLQAQSIPFMAPPSSSTSQLPYHLEQCLVDFASAEEVQDVECYNCVLEEKLAEVDAEIKGLQHCLPPDDPDLRDMLRVSVGILEAELSALQKKRATLLAQKSLCGVGGWKGLRVEGEVQGERLTPRRCPAEKRLLFSRLPPVLCFHLGRRMFDPRHNCMTKVRQKITFPPTLDMSRFAGYGDGKLSGDVAERRIPVAGSVFGGLPSAASTWHTPRAACNGSMNGGSSTLPTQSPQPSPSSLTLRSKYLLQSVIVHHGSADGGHYTAFRRLSGVPRDVVLERWGGEGLLSEDINTWVSVSDESVVSVSVGEVLAAEAYMLFYQSLDSLSDEAEGEC